MEDLNDLQGLLEDFEEEARERLQRMSQGVMALEQGVSDDETLNALFREAHTLKGTAGLLGLEQLSRLTHAVEDLLDRLRQHPDAISSAVASTLLESLDQMGELVASAVARSENNHTARTERVIGELRTLAAEQIPEAEQSPETPPEAEHLPDGPMVPTVGSTAREILRVDAAKLDRLLSLSYSLRSADQRAQQFVGRLKGMRREGRALARSVAAASAEGNGSRPDAPRRSDSADALSERLDEIYRLYGAFSRELSTEVDKLTRLIGDVRMVPVEELFRPVPRLVRDLALASGKVVELTVHGDDMQVDRRIVTELKDSLIHLVRNCIDHGIEQPVKRVEAGKLAAGQMTLRAEHRGNQAVLSVSDDGRGIDADAIRSAARRRGLIDERHARALSHAESLALVFSPGCTTSKMITDISGRGVGLDQVKATAEGLGGRVRVESTPGEGTCFYVEVPLQVSLRRMMLVRADEAVLALPTSAIERTIRVDRDQVQRLVDQQMLSVDGVTLPLFDLGHSLGVSADRLGQSAAPLRPALVLRVAGHRVVFTVDDILSETTAELRPLGRLFAGLRAVAGATILSGNEVAPVLDASGLIALARQRREGLPKATPRQSRSVLVVDDSLNARELLRAVIQGAGYKVSVAADGLDGLERARTDRFDLVVTDLEMPRMNGFELTRELRQDPAYGGKPIIIVTTRDSPTDKRAGMDAGANAYLTKGAFDQASLLDTIDRLVG